ncbi:hypothetical protein [Pseudomonas purpurea]|uniref:hypothetical protein n=1 Tax=Pseudomonas purpurea TaxID=3136737 RepID=UPI003264F366
MRILMVALASVLLVGCAGSTMKDARSQSPKQTFTSNKPDLVVAQCVQFAWQDESVFGVDASGYLQPGETGGFTVYTRSAESFIDVQNGALKYYAPQDNWVAKRRLAALAACL